METRAEIDAGRVLQERYRLEALLGRGGFGSTWSARDLRSGERVAIKRFDLRHASDWKAHELFEREVRVLSGLQHPGIPGFLDSFEDDQGAICLVQRLAPGHTLASWVEDHGWHPEEEELVALSLSLLDVLDYLHTRHPPVIHRDVKPQNLLRDAEGRLSVVDFGAVKASLSGERGVGGSTIVGTFGYMPPEQLRGVALPATDLYALGMTLLYLLTRQEPETLPTRRLKVDLEALFGARREQSVLLCWLDALIEPAPEDRPASAREARELLLARRAAALASRAPRPASEPNLTPTARDEGQKESDTKDLPVAPLVREQRSAESLAKATRFANPGCGVIGMAGLIGVTLLLALATMPTVWMVVALFGFPLFAVFISVGMAPEERYADPNIQLAEARANTVGLASATLATGAFLVVLATRSASMVWLGLFEFEALALYLMSMIYAPTWLALRRQIQWERESGEQLALMPDSVEREVRIEGRFLSGKLSHLKEKSTFSWIGFLLLGGLSWGVGVALELAPVRPGLDVFMAGHAAFGTLCASIGALLGLKWGLRRARLSIDLASRRMMGRRHGGALRHVHRDELQGARVLVRPVPTGGHEVAVRCELRGREGEVELFSVDEPDAQMAWSMARAIFEHLRQLMGEMEGGEVRLDLSPQPALEEELSAREEGAAQRAG